MKITLKQAERFVAKCLAHYKTPMLTGHPGIGKSDLMRQVASRANLEMVDCRLSTFDPTDMNGFPFLVKDGKRASFVPMDTFPLADDALPEGKNGWLIFLDEFNSAPQTVQVAAYKFVLDRLVGNRKLHPKAVIAAAGNLETSGAIVNRLGTAMQSRLIHFEIVCDTSEWLEWGAANGIDHRILAYVSRAPKNLHNFDPKRQDRTFACPRTWQFLSDLVKDIETENIHKWLPLVVGTLGEGVGSEFVAFTSIYADLPTYDTLIKHPETVEIKEDPAVHYAISHMIAAHLTRKDVKNALRFLERLGPEFQILTLKGAKAREPVIGDHPDFKRWVNKIGRRFL